MLASVCKIVASFDCSKLVWEYLQSHFFILVNADWCSGPQLKGTLSLDNSLMGSTISDNLAENFDK